MVNQEKLVIYLRTDLGEPDWFIANANYTTDADTEIFHGSTEDLSTFAEEREVIVIVPAEDVLLTTTKLPKMSRARLAQAIPYALEEQLITDVESLHFAFGDVQKDGSIGIAVVAQEKMKQWLDLLASWNIDPDQLIPFSMLVPFEENNWHVVLNEIVVIRTNIYECFTCDKNNLNDFLILALSNALELPKIIYLHNFSTESYAPTIKIPVQIEEIFGEPNRLIADFLPTLAKNGPINLLQVAFLSKKSRFSETDKLWKIAAFLGALWLVTLFAYPTVSYFILKQRIDESVAQIAQIYKRNFPESTDVVAPKMRMQDKLQKLKENIGENRFLILIGYVSEGISSRKNLKLNRFDFQNNQLTLNLNAKSPDDIAFFSSFLSQQGLNVKQENSSLIPEGINTTLVVE